MRSDRGESPCNGRAPLAEGEGQHRPFIGELGGSVSSKTDLCRDVALFAVSLLHHGHYHSGVLTEELRWLSSGIRGVMEIRIVYRARRETIPRRAKTRFLYKIMHVGLCLNTIHRNRDQASSSL